VAKQTSSRVGPGGSVLMAGRILSEGAPVPDEAIKALGKSSLAEAIANKSIVVDVTSSVGPPAPTEREVAEAKAVELGLGSAEEVKALSDADLSALIEKAAK